LVVAYFLGPPVTFSFCLGLQTAIWKESF